MCKNNAESQSNNEKGKQLGNFHEIKREIGKK